MKAWISAEPGGPETLVLGDLPEPVASAGEVVVAIEACGINFPDSLIIQDLYQTKPPRPFAPGGEIAGTVLAIGAGVAGLAPGDRVIARTAWGGLGARVAVPAAKCARMPAAMDFIEGSALLFTYGTSYHALVQRGRIAAGGPGAGTRRGWRNRDCRDRDCQGLRRDGLRRRIERGEGGLRARLRGRQHDRLSPWPA
jgi:NADPH2:quinone reductase